MSSAAVVIGTLRVNDTLIDEGSPTREIRIISYTSFPLEKCKLCEIAGKDMSIKIIYKIHNLSGA